MTSRFGRGYFHPNYVMLLIVGEIDFIFIPRFQIVHLFKLNGLRTGFVKYSTMNYRVRMNLHGIMESIVKFECWKFGVLSVNPNNFRTATIFLKY